MTTAKIAVALAALSANYTLLSRQTSEALAPVVKANAYGLGALEVARHLASQHHCAQFFTATAAEALALRSVLPEAELYVFEGVFADTRSALQQARIVPVLNSPEQVQLWQATAAPCAVHIDTGMQRLGLTPQQWRELNPQLSVQLMLTHLSHADEPEHERNTQQLEVIQTLYQSALVQHPQLQLSAVNSAGLLQQTAVGHLARPGIALYGGNPFSDGDHPMQPVAGLYGQVIQLREAPAGAMVGYGGTYVCAQDSLLATLGVGYADGVPRLLSNRGRAWLNDGFAPIVGRVSMDLLHLDVTGMSVSVGDWAEVFGAHVSVSEVARFAQTIDYEILTGLGQRPSRHYLSGSLPVERLDF